MPVTPNMGLLLPSPSSTLGPLWANLLNDALSLVDSHDHSAGNGQAIGVAGLNLQADLSFNNNRGTGFKSLIFANQSASLASTDARGLYVLNGNLFFVNGTSDVQITNGTSIVGATGNITGMGGTNASVNYNLGTFQFFSDSSVAADILCQDLTLFNNSNSNTIKLSQSASSSYVYKFPPTVAPQNNSILLFDTAGNASVSSVATLSSSGFLPLANATTPIGSSSFRWSNVFSSAGNFSGAVSVGSLTTSGAVSVGSLTSSAGISGTTGTFTGNVSSGGTLSGLDASISGNVTVTGVISGTTGVTANGGGTLLLTYRVAPGAYASGSPGTISITNPFNLNTLPLSYSNYCYIVTPQGVSTGYDFAFMVVNQGSNGFDIKYWAPSGPTVGFNVMVFGV